MIVLQIAVIALTMVALDVIWLVGRATVSRTLIAKIQGSPLEIQWLPAALCYIVMIAGVWFFAVRGVAEVAEAAMKGAALGAVVYGTYDLTSWATLKNYTPVYAIADWLWGTTLFAATAAAATAVATAATLR